MNTTTTIIGIPALHTASPIEATAQRFKQVQNEIKALQEVADLLKTELIKEMDSLQVDELRTGAHIIRYRLSSKYVELSCIMMLPHFMQNGTPTSTIILVSAPPCFGYALKFILFVLKEQRRRVPSIHHQGLFSAHVHMTE